jgi:tetratricopeptide (TPR) repeat protein
LFLLGRVLAKLNRFDEALAALDRALETHPMHPGSLGRKIWCYYLLHDWKKAHAWLRTSKRHHGKLLTYSRYEGAHYLYLGRLEKSRASLERACERGTEGSSFYHVFVVQLAEHFICARDFEASITLIEKIVEENPDGLGAQGIVEPLFQLGIAHEQLGRYNEALAALHRAYEFLFAPKIGQEPWKPSSEKELTIWIPAAIGMVHAAMGDLPEAQAALDGLRTCPENRGGQSARAVLCFRMGLLDEGFEALDLAVANHDWFILTIKTHPWFDPVRDDPRFAAVLKRMNLAD